MDCYYVWEILSYSWSEIGIEDDECRFLIEKGGITREDLAEIERIYYRDICLSFAVESFLIFPLMAWMIMPDWGYNEDYLRSRMKKWYSRPYWVHFLNPLRWLGYPIAIFFSNKYKSMLIRLVNDSA